MVVSMWSGASLEEIANVAPYGLRWLHITPLSDRNLMKRILKRAERAGYRGVFVTLDRPVAPKSLNQSRLFKLWRRFPIV